MKTLVLDESLDISPSIHRFLAARGVDGVFVCSAQEFEMAEASQGPMSLRVVNLSSAITAWEVARHLKVSPAGGPTRVFFDATAQGIEPLAALPGVECRERPRIGERRELAERDEAREHGNDKRGKDGDAHRGTARRQGREAGRKQPVARHGEEDAALAIKEGENDGRQRDDR